MYQFKRTQLIRTDLQTCWKYFSAPANLRIITPNYIDFQVHTAVPDLLYEGLIIRYTIRPILGIRLTWISEIRKFEEGVYFVDEQRRGPYNLWHHEHHFKEVSSGVEMTDLITYRMPFGFVGKFVHWLFIRKQLESIFDYRARKADELFNSPQFVESALSESLIPKVARVRKH